MAKTGGRAKLVRKSERVEQPSRAQQPQNRRTAGKAINTMVDITESEKKREAQKLQQLQKAIDTFLKNHYTTYERYWKEAVTGGSWGVQLRIFVEAFVAPKSALTRAIQARYRLIEEVKNELLSMTSEEHKLLTEETLKEAIRQVRARDSFIQQQIEAADSERSDNLPLNEERLLAEQAIASLSEDQGWKQILGNNLTVKKQEIDSEAVENRKELLQKCHNDLKKDFIYLPKDKRLPQYNKDFFIQKLKPEDDKSSRNSDLNFFALKDFENTHGTGGEFLGKRHPWLYRRLPLILRKNYPKAWIIPMREEHKQFLKELHIAKFKRDVQYRIAQKEKALSIAQQEQALFRELNQEVQSLEKIVFIATAISAQYQPQQRKDIENLQDTVIAALKNIAPQCTQEDVDRVSSQKEQFQHIQDVEAYVNGLYQYVKNRTRIQKHIEGFPAKDEKEKHEIIAQQVTPKLLEEESYQLLSQLPTAVLEKLLPETPKYPKNKNQIGYYFEILCTRCKTYVESYNTIVDHFSKNKPQIAAQLNAINHL